MINITYQTYLPFKCRYNSFFSYRFYLLAFSSLCISAYRFSKFACLFYRFRLAHSVLAWTSTPPVGKERPSTTYNCYLLHHGLWGTTAGYQKRVRYPFLNPEVSIISNQIRATYSSTLQCCLCMSTARELTPITMSVTWRFQVKKSL